MRRALAMLGVVLLVTGCGPLAENGPKDTSGPPQVDEGYSVASWCATTTPGIRVFYGGRGVISAIADPACKGKQS